MSLPQAPLILLVFANDKQAYLESIRQERSELLALLAPIAMQLGMELKDIDYTTVEGVIELINVQRERLVVLHFAGHSNIDLLNLDQGQLHAIGLADKLKRCTNLRLVFFNGCNNVSLAKAIAQAGINNVIGTRERIIDKVAKQFSYYFYIGLAEQQLSVSEAYIQAWSNISAQTGENYRSLDIFTSNNETNWAWYLLSSDSTWTLAQAANPCNRLPTLSRNELPSSPYKNLAYYEVKDAEVFFGRCRELLEVIDILDSTKEPILILQGGTGVGKSSFLQAGLIARLQARKQQVYYKRLTNLDTKQEIIEYLFTSNKIEQIATYLHQPNAEGLPAIWVIDQVEELFFLDEKNVSNLKYNSINQLLTIIYQIFYPSNLAKRPEAKILFCLRTEWFGKLYDACKLWNINHSSYLLKPPDKMAIMEIIESPATIDYLKQFYQLTIVDPPYGYLAEQIADDLLVDKESTIAPTLQIILSRLWDKVVNKPERIWDEGLYLEEKRAGLLLNDYLDKQLQDIALSESWGKGAQENGLLLDILYAHTESGRSKSLSIENYNQLYAHIPYRLEVLKSLKNRYLLIEPQANTNENLGKYTRIIHDTLAELVQQRFSQSDFPGQRAKRILETRKLMWVLKENKYHGPSLDKKDLKMVVAGQIGTQTWSDIEQAIIIYSTRQRTWQNIKSGVGGFAISLLLALGIAIISTLDSAQQEKLVRHYRDEYGLLQNKKLDRLNKLSDTEIDNLVGRLNEILDTKIDSEHTIVKYTLIAQLYLMKAVLMKIHGDNKKTQNYAQQAAGVANKVKNDIFLYGIDRDFIKDKASTNKEDRYATVLFILIHAYAILYCSGNGQAKELVNFYKKELNNRAPDFFANHLSNNDICLDKID